MEGKLVTKTAIPSSSLVKKLTKKIYQNPLTSSYLYVILCIKKERNKNMKYEVIDKEGKFVLLTSSKSLAELTAKRVGGSIIDTYLV